MEKVFFIDQLQGPKYMQLYEAIAIEIKNGRLRANEKMPSVRQLSKAMLLSGTTVENAYGQLVAEGFLYSKPKSGYYVTEIGEFGFPKDRQGQIKEHSIEEEKQKCTYDFVSEYADPVNFYIGVWKKNINTVFSQYENSLYEYAKPFGEEMLKNEVANYFSRVRGIKAEPSQIIIGGGTQFLLRSFSLLLKGMGYNVFSIDNPGFPLAKKVFLESGFIVNGIPLKNKVINPEFLSDQSQILFTSPSYQFPYGEIMPVKTRNFLIQWANRTNSYIIEDDYNNELRYVGKPVKTLQGMDHYNRTVYIGSFSTLLIPSIRISFMVLPPFIADQYKKSFKQSVQSASKLEQLALGQMIKSGDLSKHIRKIRIEYSKKQIKLTNLWKSIVGDLASLYVPQSGLTAVVTLKSPVLREKLKSEMVKLDLNVALMSEYLVEDKEKELEKKLVLNYRGISNTYLKKGIDQIKELICRLY